MIKNIFASVTILLGLSSGVASYASEDNYPTRPIKIVVPVNAGGTSDFFARLVGRKLQDELKVPVVVENYPGGGGLNGSTSVARAASDGYTLLLASGGTHSISPNVFKKMPYDAIKDYEPIIRLATTTNVLVVSSKSPSKSASDLLNYAKKNPSELSFASSGNGTIAQLAGESFKNLAGTDIVHVPYPGSSPALMSLMGGQVSMMFDNIPSALPLIKSEKLKALAVTSAARSPALPNVPTMAESGFKGFEMSTWFGILAPKGTPAPITEHLNKAIFQILKDKDLQNQFLERGAVADGNSKTDFKTFMGQEIVKWKKIADDVKVQIDQ